MASEQTIKGGPSKWDLMLALFDGNTGGPRYLDFHLESGKLSGAVVVSSVEREDGSGESWNITGRTGSIRVVIYYNTHTRRGTYREKPWYQQK